MDYLPYFLTVSCYSLWSFTFSLCPCGFPPTFQKLMTLNCHYVWMSVWMLVYAWCPVMGWYPIQVVYSCPAPSVPQTGSGSAVTLTTINKKLMGDIGITVHYQHKHYQDMLLIANITCLVHVYYGNPPSKHGVHHIYICTKEFLKLHISSGFNLKSYIQKNK